MSYRKRIFPRANIARPQQQQAWITTRRAIIIV